MTDHVRVERGGGVLAITLNRPERRNAITVEMYGLLADAIAEAFEDGETRVITIRGEGKDFAAGNDLADFLGAERGDDLPVWRLLRALAECEIPMIAAVHGNCVGIGTTMLLHCDLVIAADNSRFSMPFVDLGLVPEAASSMLLPRLTGGGARRVICCSAMRSGRTRRWRSGSRAMWWKRRPWTRSWARLRTGCWPSPPKR